MFFLYNFMRASIFSRKQDKVWGANWFRFSKQVKLVFTLLTGRLYFGTNLDFEAKIWTGFSDASAI